ncbi:MAG: phage tail sheath family protein [Chitinophagaceae bacterium]|nr:phage tail sheath family protein [Chitinophagaceae bacterium]
MASTYMTPGVYIEEKNAFPGSVVAVETAVPVFIGYTEKAERKSKSLTGEPTRITSFAEYVELFGQGKHHKFKLTAAGPPPFTIKAFSSDLLLNPNEIFYFYNCIRLFYQNGGSNCYIFSLGNFEGDGITKPVINKNDFVKHDVFNKLKRSFEPTIVLIPDFVNDRNACYGLYTDVLKHCKETQSRFGIFDVIPETDETLDETFAIFRTAIGSEALNYGAAYYPWLNTSIVKASEINFTNLDVTTDDLKIILPEKNVTAVIDTWNAAKKTTATETEDEAAKRIETENTNLHQALIAVSTTYTQIMAEIKHRLNLLPPGAAMAGIYSLVDSTRGVWKSPANVSLSMVNSPAVNISHEEQEKMNIDAVTGKSINAIRPFPGIGSLVWGARTLDGNSQDWRYINVRRTMIMIEQSLKLACRAYVFEPNDANTWVTIKNMMNNFLNNLWKQGALAGAVPEQAFDVQVGLGATMTPTDILDGLLLVTVKLAIVRPAEFIVLTFQQQQQQS